MLQAWHEERSSTKCEIILSDHNKSALSVVHAIISKHRLLLIMWLKRWIVISSGSAWLPLFGRIFFIKDFFIFPSNIQFLNAGFLITVHQCNYLPHIRHMSIMLNQYNFTNVHTWLTEAHYRSLQPWPNCSKQWGIETYEASPWEAAVTQLYSNQACGLHSLYFWALSNINSVSVSKSETWGKGKYATEVSSCY